MLINCVKIFFSDKASIKIPHYVILVCVIHLFFFNCIVTKYGMKNGGDSSAYIEATTLFSQSFDISDILRSKRGVANFTYCLFMGIFVAIFGINNVYALYCLNLSISLITLLMLMKLVNIITGKALIVFVAGLLFAVSHLIAFWSCYTFLTDTFFMMLLMAYTLTLYKIIKAPGPKSFLISNLVFMLLFFTKTVSLGFAPLHCLILGFFSLQYLRQHKMNSWTYLSLTVIAPLVAIVAIKISIKQMNSLEKHQLEGIVSTYYKGYIFYEQLKQKDDPAAQYLFSRLHLYEEVPEKKAEQSLIGFIVSHPMKTVILWSHRFYYFWKPVMRGFKEDFNQWNYLTVSVPGVFAVIGIFLLVCGKKFDLIFWIPFLLLLSNSVVYCLTWLAYERRFLMPLLPFVYMYTSIAVWQIKELGFRGSRKDSQDM